MDINSGIPKVFSILMELVKSREEEDEEEDVLCINEKIDQIAIDDSEDDNDVNDLDIILEENILEEKIKGLSNEHNHSSDELTDLIGLPKRTENIYDEQLKIVEVALQQNRKLKKILQSLECEFLLLKREFDRCGSNATPCATTEQLHNMEFYGSFCAPYFKCHGFSCLVNSDQSAKERLKPMLYEDNDIIGSWEEDELVILEQSIRDMIVQQYFSNLEEVGSSLKGEQDSDHKIKVINEVSFIRTADLLEVFKKYDENTLDWDRISVNFYNPHSGRDCKLMWDLYLKPSIKKDKWTRKEERALISAAKNLGFQNWDNIALKLGSNRTGYQCFSHYQQHLCKIAKKWSPEEIAHFQTVLRLAKHGESINWSRIKYFIDNSNFITLYNKWYKTKCISNEKARKGKFNLKEDKFILCALKKGIPLQEIHRYLKSRNVCQIRERYTNYLDVKDRKYGSWSSEEDALLLKLVKEYGEGQWAKIATHFISRSRTQIRQHYENLKKLIIKNPNIDLEKIKRRRNTYTNKHPIKRLNKDIKTSDKDLKTIPSEIDFFKDKEDIELIKHFVYKKLVFTERKSIGNTFTSNSEEIIKISHSLNVKLPVNQISSCGINEYRKHLHEYIFGSMQFVQKSKDLSFLDGSNDLGNSINLLPPNIATVNSLRNILSRLEIEKIGTDKKTDVESNVTKTKGPAYKNAVENWCKRMLLLFSSSFILEGIGIEWYKSHLKSMEKNEVK